MTIELEGVPSSAEVRADLAAQGRPVLLAFSRGKDSLAVWVSLVEAGVEVIPCHLYSVPHLGFIDSSIRDFEAHFGTRIRQYPHPWIYRALTGYYYQPPERCGTIDAAQLATYDFPDLWAAVREDLGLPEDTWVCDGTRACDSPMRRIACKTHGPWRPKSGYKCLPVWDWQVADVRSALTAAGVDLPVDYDWFGRSFDGIDPRFLGPLRDHAPEDYERVLEWFPLADLVFLREQMRDRVEVA